METILESRIEPKEIAGERLWDVPRFISKGRNGSVYQISDDLVAKIGYSIFYEEKILKSLYELNISVPKPEGIYELTNYHNLPTLSNDFFLPALLMEYIDGETGFDLAKDSSKLNFASDLVDIELKKAKEYGFHPRDAEHVGNFILTPNKKIVLIDFAEWHHPDIIKPVFN